MSLAVEQQTHAAKDIVFKKRRRKGYKKFNTFRRPITVLRVNGIDFDLGGVDAPALAACVTIWIPGNLESCTGALDALATRAAGFMDERMREVGDVPITEMFQGFDFSALGAGTSTEGPGALFSAFLNALEG